MFKNNKLYALFGACLLTITTNIFALSDVEIDELFDQGVEQSDAGDVHQAIEIFENILTARPDMHRVQLELALANFRALNFVAAKQLATEILNKPTTPESVKKTIVAFLEEVDQDSKPHQFNASVSVGYIYDDNINVGPSASTIQVANGTLTINQGDQPIESSGVQIVAGVGHRYLFPNSFKIGKTHAALSWQSQASLFRNHYFDGSGDNHVNVASLKTGPSLLASRKWQASLPLQYDLITVGDNKVGYYLGLTPSYTHYISRDTLLSGSFQAQLRDFEPAFDDNRDSLYTAFAVDFLHRFQARYRPIVRFGAGIFNEDADTRRRSNDGFQLSAAISAEPNDKSYVYARYNYMDVEFDDVEPLFGIARDEEEHRFNVGGNYRVETATPLQDFLLNLNYTYTDRKSNVAIFEYDRNQAVFSLTKSF